MATPTLKNSDALKTKVRYFDLDAFENKSLDVPYSYTDEKDLEAAKKLVDEKTLLEAINDILRREAMMAARKAALPEGAADRKLVNNFVASFAQLSPWDAMPENTREEKKAKKASILTAIKAWPAVVDGLKAKARMAGVNVDDAEVEDEDEK